MDADTNNYSLFQILNESYREFQNTCDDELLSAIAASEQDYMNNMLTDTQLVENNNIPIRNPLHIDHVHPLAFVENISIETAEQEQRQITEKRRRDYNNNEHSFIHGSALFLTPCCNKYFYSIYEHNNSNCQEIDKNIQIKILLHFNQNLK